jgi:hypothetical protein
MNTLHQMLLADGRFAGTTRDELEASFEAFAASPQQGTLAIHFHGGLVPEKSGRQVAERLLAPYRDDGGAWPIFPVWRSGPLETIRYNWDEILKEDVFPLLVERVTRFVLGKLGQDEADKGARVELPLLADIRAEIDTAADQEEEPFTEREPDTERLDGALPTNERLQFERMLEDDATFRRAADRLVRPDGPRLVSVLQAEADLARAEATSGDKAIVSTTMLVTAATRILSRALRRLARGRGHGIYTTVIEETARELKGDLVGGILWTNMKRDCADAFAGPAETHGGTALLDAIAGQWAQGHRHRVVLIGHSTGAVWIAEMLKAAARMGDLPAELRFEIILLAPACTFTLLDEALSIAPARVAAFRTFAMKEPWERRDRLVRPVPFLYPRSLLYFVSGVVEEAVDMPLVGMQRYHFGTPPYDPERMPAIASLQKRVSGFEAPWVWSRTEGSLPSGQASLATHHGDFDNDAATIGSIVHLLKAGF